MQGYYKSQVAQKMFFFVRSQYMIIATKRRKGAAKTCFFWLFTFAQDVRKLQCRKYLSWLQNIYISHALQG